MSMKKYFVRNIVVELKQQVYHVGYDDGFMKAIIEYQPRDKFLSRLQFNPDFIEDFRYHQFYCLYLRDNPTKILGTAFINEDMLKMVSLDNINLFIRHSTNVGIRMRGIFDDSEKEKLEKLSLAIKDEEFECTAVTVFGNSDVNHQLAKVVSAVFDKLSKLALYEGFSPKICDMLIERLSAGCTLRELHIVKCGIDDNTFRILIPKLPVLYSIDLRSNRLSQLSLYRLISHLTPKSNLKEISFSSNCFVSKNFDEIDANKINYDVILKKFDITFCGDIWDCYKQIVPIAVRISQELVIHSTVHSIVIEVIKEFEKRDIKPDSHLLASALRFFPEVYINNRN